METVVLLIHLLIAIALVGVVLLQKTEGGALGIGGGGNNFMAGRSSADPLTKLTAMLALAFFVTSITLTIMAKNKVNPGSKLTQPATDATKILPKTPEPEAPKGPQVPKSR